MLNGLFGQCAGQELIAGATHPAQIDRRFGDALGEPLDFGIGIKAGDFVRERFHFFGQSWIGRKGQAQTVAKSVSGSAGPSPGAHSRGWIRFSDRSSRHTFFFCLRCFDHFKLGVFNLLHALPQRLAEDRPTPIDLAQAGVPAPGHPGGA
jgi:hypothetical protein